MAHSTVIVATLPSDLGRTVRDLQETYRQRFGDPRVSTLPPHITLVEPFREYTELEDLERVARLEFQPAPVRCTGYGTFASRAGNVIYIALECPALYRVRQEVLTIMPHLVSLVSATLTLHITIARRVPHAVTTAALALLTQAYEPSCTWSVDHLAVFQRPTPNAPWCNAILTTPAHTNPST